MFCIDNSSINCLLKQLHVLKTAKWLSSSQVHGWLPHFPPNTIKVHHGAEVGPSLLYFIYELAVVLILNPPQHIHHLRCKWVLKSAAKPCAVGRPKITSTSLAWRSALKHGYASKTFAGLSSSLRVSLSMKALLAWNSSSRIWQTASWLGFGFLYISCRVQSNAWPVLPDYLFPLKGNTNQQQVLDMSSEWYYGFKPSHKTFWVLYFHFNTMESNKWKLLAHHNTSKPNHYFNVKFKNLQNIIIYKTIVLPRLIHHYCQNLSFSLTWTVAIRTPPRWQKNFWFTTWVCIIIFFLVTWREVNVTSFGWMASLWLGPLPLLWRLPIHNALLKITVNAHV